MCFVFKLVAGGKQFLHECFPSGRVHHFLLDGNQHHGSSIGFVYNLAHVNFLVTGRGQSTVELRLRVYAVREDFSQIEFRFYGILNNHLHVRERDDIINAFDYSDVICEHVERLKVVKLIDSTIL